MERRESDVLRLLRHAVGVDEPGGEQHQAKRVHQPA